MSQAEQACPKPDSGQRGSPGNPLLLLAVHNPACGTAVSSRTSRSKHGGRADSELPPGLRRSNALHSRNREPAQVLVGCEVKTRHL
eukprot:3519892-Rhodomonas_salina.1